MATIKTNHLKNGAKSYTIQVRVKDKFYTKTWKQPTDLKEKDAKRELEKIKIDFEEEIRIKENGLGLNPTFRQVAEDWLRVCESSRAKTHYVRTKEIIFYFNKVLGDKRMKEIDLHDVQRIFLYLNNKDIISERATLKKSLDDIIEDKKIKDVCKNCGFSKTTFQFVRKNKSIQMQTAKAICKEFNLNFDMYFDKVQEKRKYAYESKLKFKRVLSTIFNHAVLHDIITKNLASKKYIKDIISGERQERDVLSDTESKMLGNALQNEPISKERVAITLLLYMALRIGELAGLEWKDIDFENKTLSVNRTVSCLKEFGEIVKEPKTKKSKRTLTMPCHVVELLKEYKVIYNEQKEKLGDAWIDKDRIIARYNGNYTTPKTVGTWLTKLLIKNGIKNVTPHSLRHTNLTAQIRKGISITIVSKFAGHSETSTTMNTYSHFLPEDKNVSADFLENAFK